MTQKMYMDSENDARADIKNDAKDDSGNDARKRLSLQV